MDGSGERARLGRLHPLSPYVHGWKWFAAAAAIIAPQTLDDVSPLVAGLIVLAAIPIAAVYGFFSWRFTRYGFDGEDFRLDQGLLFRRSRRVRLDRLQAVDVVRPVVARALGLAELRLEVAGGSNEATLAYLSEADAQRLRAELLARAAGLRGDEPEAPERVLHRVPTQRLVFSALLSTGVLLALVLVPLVVVGSLLTGGIGAAIVSVPAAVGFLTPLIRQVVGNFEFTVAESPDGLRLRRGLMQTRAQTVPPGRVQALRIVEPWLWRRFTDWVRLEVTVAGYAGGSSEDNQSSSLLLPVAPRTEAMALLARVLPGVDVLGVPVSGVPRRARWLDPLAWRRLALGADDGVIVARRGLVRHETDVMRHERAQSVRWRQGPLQRRLGLADVHIDTTPGPVHVHAAHRDAGEALAVVEREIVRARAARASAGPERWMTAAAAAGGDRREDAGGPGRGAR
jgi:putative membrane protein